MKHWCCLCGVEDVDPAETCPVSEFEMGREGHGLRHLIARRRDPVAVGVFNGSAAKSRAAMRKAESPSEGPSS